MSRILALLRLRGSYRRLSLECGALKARILFITSFNSQSLFQRKSYMLSIR
jgi:hypothetical protein